MSIILRKMHRIVLVFWMVLFFFIFWPLLKYLSVNQKRWPFMIRLRKLWALISSAMGGVWFTYDFEQPIDWSRTYIVCPNHASNLDIQAMSILLGHTSCSFMGKSTLLNNFLTSIYFRTVDIPVDRDSKISSYKAFKAATEKLQNGTNMILFPEGGTADIYPPVVGEFKNGPFKMAIELKIPIIPVTSLNTWKIFWDDGTIYGSRPGVCNVYVHQPIETAHLTLNDADNLRDQVHAIISQKFNQA